MAKEWANDMDSSPQRSAACKNLVRFLCSVTMGSSGAVTSVTADNPKFSATYGGSTGLLNITLPRGKSAFIVASIRTSAVTAILDCITNTVDANAGTAVLRFRNVTLAVVNPESGLVLDLIIEVER